MKTTLASGILLCLLVAGCAATPESANVTTSVAPAPEPSAEAGFGSIRGIVTDVEGNPLAGAEAALVGTELAAKTDEAGMFTFNQLEPAEYALIVQKVGYSQVGRKVLVPAGEVVEARIQLEPFEVAPEPYIDLVIRKAVIEFGQVFLDNRYPYGFSPCQGCDSYLRITLGPTAVHLDQKFTNGVAVPNDDIWIDFRINFQNATGSNSQNDGTSLGSAYLKQGQAWDMTENGVKALEKVDLVWYHVASGLPPSINKRIDSYVSFAYNGDLPDGYSALPK